MVRKLLTSSVMNLINTDGLGGSVQVRQVMGRPPREGPGFGSDFWRQNWRDFSMDFFF